MNRREILTIPNAITGVRALGIPLFLYAYLALENTGLALAILILGAVSDYFDGKVARLLNQESALGAMLDPTIDRLYIAATVIALVAKDVVPLWVLALLISRDIWMTFVLAIKKSKGFGVFEVTFLGKAATFNLLYSIWYCSDFLYRWLGLCDLGYWLVLGHRTAIHISCVQRDNEQ